MSPRGTVLPSDLLAWFTQINLEHEDGLSVLSESGLALDTETSGLWVDSGARVSTVSIAVEDPHALLAPLLGVESLNGRTQRMWDGGVWTYGLEEVATGQPRARVFSAAWPFDQGVSNTGKPEDSGQDALWPDADNQPLPQWQALLDLLRLAGPTLGLVFQNAKFDLHLMSVGVRRWPGVGIDLLPWTEYDTQNGSDLLYSRLYGTASLKPVAKKLWGEAEGDEQQVVKSYLAGKKLPSGRWDLMPWDLIGRYADQDARLTLRLRLRQQIDLQQAGQRGWLDGQSGRMRPDRALDRRMDVTRMLYRVERRGLPFDVQGALGQREEIERRIADLQARLPFQPPTLPMAKHYWFGSGKQDGVQGMGLVPYDTTETGGPKLSQSIVGKMVADGIPGADVWRDLQKLTTANDRWYTGWTSRAGADGRLRTGIRQNGTVSGRFSVENIQLQAIPHDYRLSGFTSLDGITTPRTLIKRAVPDGWSLWELDLSQAELRVAARMANCSRMLRLIERGDDLHGDAAVQLLQADPSSPDWDKMRNVAKRANFSLIFGVGWETLQEAIENQVGLRMPDHAVQQLVKGWNGLYPEFQQAIKTTSATVEARARRNGGRGWVTLLNGERRWFRPGEDTHKAFNQRVQANLAQYGIDLWLESEEDLRETLGDGVVEGVGRVGMVLMVHDSMVLLLPDDRTDEIVPQVQRFAGELWDLWFPGVPGALDAKRW